MSTKSNLNLVSERKVERDKQQYGNINLIDNVKRKEIEKVHCNSKSSQNLIKSKELNENNYGKMAAAVS